MQTAELTGTLTTLFGELVDGVSGGSAYMLNSGDEGLLRSLDKLQARSASTSTATGSSIAAHVDHLRYGLSLLNRWSRGEHPYSDADWSASWKKTAYSEDEWKTLRAQLWTEVAAWKDVLQTPREVSQGELNDLIGSIAHLAYHLGAIRQIDRTTRGPAAEQSAGISNP